jgi:hypothetical protein
MGLFDGLFGGDDDPDDGTTPDEGTTPDGGAGADEGTTPDDGHGASTDPLAGVPSPTADPVGAVDAVAAATGGTRREREFAVLRAVADDPAAFAPHVGALLDRADGDGPAAFAAATAVEGVAASDPRSVAGHADELLALAARTDEDGGPTAVAEAAADTLGHLARAGHAPVDGLLERLAGGPNRALATAPLAAVAAEDPGALPAERLRTLRDDDDPATASGARYVRAVRAGTTGDPPAATADALVRLARESAGVPPLARADLLPAAARVVVGDVLHGADVTDLRLASTPMGVQVVLSVADPARVAGEDGEGARRVAVALAERLDLADPQVDVQGPGD